MRTHTSLSALGLIVLAGTALASGPDVTLQNIPDISTYGPVGGVYGYVLGSGTCNIGNTNLQWLNNGTPGLAMNAFRLRDGRMTQIGLGFVKTACCAAAGSGCGTCNGQGGSVLGAGCKDTYGAGWNAQQARLGPRSTMNAFTGAFTSFPGTSGDAIFRRVQVAATDLDPAQNPGALYFAEGVYVASDDAANGNWYNNATYQRVTIAPGTMAMTLQGAAQSTIPAIRAWRDHGLGVGIPDTSVTVSTLDVPGEGRFWYAFKPRDLGNGTWRYEYGIYNLCSDRSGGSFSVPLPAGVNATNVGFSAPRYHSGEPYDNTAWVISTSGGQVSWTSPQTFAQNPNSNALRWGTMYSFWFDANSAPVLANASLGLFKPHVPQSVAFQVSAPGAPCYPNCDGSTVQPTLNVNDFGCFLNLYAAADPRANCDNSTLPPVLNAIDFACYLNAFATGCP